MPIQAERRQPAGMMDGLLLRDNHPPHATNIAELPDLLIR